MSPDLERLIGRAIIDRGFREKLMQDPDDAVKDAGFSLTPDELEKVRQAAKEGAADAEATNRALDAASQGIWA